MFLNMVLEVGLEPTMELNPADLQSAVIATRRLQQVCVDYSIKRWILLGRFREFIAVWASSPRRVW